ncbi:ComF family protein [Streptomyces sp. NPDC088194]|uniref:ComF family protein n=1 Tax=Streptomyces sp. NPDC088194 TaxID=3154931 RepID=UPI00344DE8DD
MRGWWREITGLVLPVDCAGCGSPRTELCERCHGLLGGAATARRVRPSPEPPGLPPVYAAGRYGDEVRAVVLAHKERGALGLARPLGEALAGAVVRATGPIGALPGPAVPHAVGHRWNLPGRAPAAADADHGSRLGLWPVLHGLEVPRTALRGTPGSPVPRPASQRGPLLLVPVPSSRRAVAQRGHDATARIARSAARELRRQGVPARAAAVLRQRRPVADQSELSADGRLANLCGAVAAAGSAVPLLAAAPVVLVDDLMTTGASLAVAAGAVAAVGGWVAGAAVVAGPHDSRID